jgi:hypothetical protein
MAMNPRLLRPTASGFDPRRIAGLQGWWDAADLSSMAQNSDGTTAVTSTSDPVGFWRDKSGNGRHARQTTNNNRPTVQLADKNGRAGLDFDGSNDYFACDSGAAHRVRYAYAVVRRTGTNAAWGAIFKIRNASSDASISPNSAQDMSLQRVNLEAGSLFGLLQAGGLARLNGQTITTVNSGQFNIHSAALLPNTTDTNVIGIQGNVTDTAGTQYPFISLDPFAASRVFQMRLYELLVYDTVPNTATLQQVERYLGRKWGITIA